MKYTLTLISALFVFMIFTTNSYSQCSNDADCDNLLFCDGLERCESTGLCSSGPNPCAPGLPCDEVADTCVSVCPDADADGHKSIECGGDDCDDGDPERSPSHAEVCDTENRDEDCDCRTFGGIDFDGDGFISDQCCNVCPDGSMNCGRDCDNNPFPFGASIHPISIEVCNGRDDNCDGLIDNGATVEEYEDSDMDGHGDPDAAMDVCADTVGFSPLGNDCDDNNEAIKPGAMVCSPTDPFMILVCNNSGDFNAVECLGGCVVQPNGTGVCPRANDRKPN